jgi:hypothetical protein
MNSNHEISENLNYFKTKIIKKKSVDLKLKWTHSWVNLIFSNELEVKYCDNESNETWFKIKFESESWFMCWYLC